MTNDLKLGSVDVANVRFGNNQVSKIMRGTTEVWASGGPPPPVVPALVDSFVAVDTSYANSPNHAIAVPTGKSIPAGSLLVVASVVNGILLTGLSMADNSSQAGTANSYARRSTDSWLQGSNAGGYLWVSLTTRQINAADVITFTHSGASRNRHVSCVAWFSGTFPDTTISGNDAFATGNSAAWATGTQSSAATAPSLDLAMTIGTAATPPWTYGGGFTKTGDGVTASGTSDRGGSLGYRVSSAAGARSASGTNTSAVWGAGLVAVDYTP